MTDLDDRLQASLARLETGEPLGEVLSDAQGDEADLAQLIQLAAMMRDMPHPEPRATIQRRPLLATTIHSPNGSSGHKWRLPMWRSRWWTTGLVGAAGVALIVVLGTVLWLGSAWLNGADTSAATLREVHGRVEIGGTEGDAWHAASPGEHIRSGQRVRTGPGASVAVVFFEGTITRVGANSEVVLNRVDGHNGNVLQVELSQVVGTTTHRVVPLRGADAKFVVNTPGGTAQVHGTTFSVAVASDGATRYAVDRGRVVVDSAQHQVILDAGQATIVESGQSPAPPAYQFVGSGAITSLQETAWVVGGVPMIVTPGALALLTEPPAVGTLVSVTGRILADGTWMADSVAVTEASDGTFSFTGPLEGIEGDVWTIAHVAVAVNSDTERATDLQPGSVVNVTFRVSDGVRVALRILAVDASGTEPTATPTASPDPAAQPSLAFQPDDLRQSGCLPTYTFNGTLRNTAQQSDDIAANVELTYTIARGAEFVDNITLTPESWTAIAAGDQVSFLTAVVVNAAWPPAPLGSTIEVQVTVGNETNRPGQHTTRLTLIIESTCDAAATSTPTITTTPTMTTTLTPTSSVTPIATVTATPTITATPSTTPTASSTPTITTTPVVTDTVCTGADPHPHGLTLAQKYGVSYEEIMGWFCQGYGFGEIEHAYDLSLETGIPVTEIFALRASGLGWGQIKQQLNAGPGESKPTKVPKGTPPGRRP